MTDKATRDALLWLLWCHQGGRSEIGQPIRKMLGMYQFDRMTDEQVAVAKQFAARLDATPPDEYQRGFSDGYNRRHMEVMAALA